MTNETTVFCVIPFLTILAMCVLVGFFPEPFTTLHPRGTDLDAPVLLGFVFGICRLFQRAGAQQVCLATILLNGVATIVLFALIYQQTGIVCAAADCSNSITVSGLQIYSDLPTALYFSIVTFTTLGYGDLQPMAQMQHRPKRGAGGEQQHCAPHQQCTHTVHMGYQL